MSKILGLDLGTNSIGWALRNPDNIETQFEKYGVTIFETGVGSDKTGEFSFSQRRTQKRSARRLYQARKYRLWATLDVLIKEGYCPLTDEQLKLWKNYDKINKRKYPHIEVFEQWIRLDFNGDGKPDYKSPYQLRAELMEIPFDFTKETDRYKLGRALYHIAQRRGFRSSRKDAEADDKGGRKIIRSEKDKEDKFDKKLKEHFDNVPDFKTIGQKLAFIEKTPNKNKEFEEFERIRKEWVQNIVQRQYKDECSEIFTFQNIGIDSTLYKAIVEDGNNRYNGTIFYRRPLRSQKGLVGHCTLENGKARCPISHPSFEEFRALSLINNIQYKTDGDWLLIPQDWKKELYDECFLKTTNFNFDKIKDFLSKKTSYKLDYRNRTINYSDKTNVSACPISARLKNIFGEDWQTVTFEYEKTYTNKKDGKAKTEKVTYTINDIWHVLFSFDNEELVYDFALKNLGLTEKQAEDFEKLWYAMPEGYGMLSLNAIEKILPFLREGLIYTEAVLMANIPSILGKEIWNNIENQNIIKKELKRLISLNQSEKKQISIVNNLVSKYKSKPYNEKPVKQDMDYCLNETDKEEIVNAIIETYGDNTWEKNTDKQEIIDKITYLYQCTFRMGFDLLIQGEDKYHKIEFKGTIYLKSTEHQFYKLPRVVDTIGDFLITNFSDKINIEKLYHPSMIAIYPASQRDENDRKIYLQSPKTGAFKNPMAMRTLHELQKLTNYLIKKGDIDDSTRVVVEVARELNDANKRWAIKAYQDKRQAENKEFAIAIAELKKDPNFKGIADNESNSDIDKMRIWYENLSNNNDINKGKDEHIWSNITNELIQSVFAIKDKDIDKYSLWKKQKCQCLYCGKTISLTDLFNEDTVEFEHTIPRSQSFDNSLANITVCHRECNRLKSNRIPAQLDSYDQILDRIGLKKIIVKDKIEFETIRNDSWASKVEQIKSNIEHWKGESKKAPTIERKNDAIRQRHLWSMELEYWGKKLYSFKMQEVTSGFKNSQLVDTQLITKYALHYLKTAFNTVDVQKGENTAEFRKIYSIQPKYEKKDRTKHSHHAKDAAVLTLIPYSAKREEILKKAYEYEEKQRNQYTESPYKGYKTTDITSIEENILINNISRNQALSPSSRIVRKRGKIVYLRDKQGNYLLDENGKPKPKIATGDSIRGQLHDETFLSAIIPVKRDENDKPILENERMIPLQKPVFAKRVELKFKKNDNDSGFKTLNELKPNFKDYKGLVDKHLYLVIEKQVKTIELEIKEQIDNNIDVKEKNAFKVAIERGIYMLTKTGERVNRIRHVRIFVRDKEPLIIKHQTYISSKPLVHLNDREHKNFYYAANACNYAYALYQGKVKDNIERAYDIINLFNISETINDNANRQLSIASEKEYNKNGDKLPLYAVLKVGQKVLFFLQHSDELIGADSKFLSKRMYKITGFEPDDGRIRFIHHLEAREDKNIKEDVSSEIIFDKYIPKFRLTKGKFRFLIENIDFEVQPDGTIIFK